MSLIKFIPRHLSTSAVKRIYCNESLLLVCTVRQSLERCSKRFRVAVPLDVWTTFKPSLELLVACGSEHEPSLEIWRIFTLLLSSALQREAREF